MPPEVEAGPQEAAGGHGTRTELARTLGLYDTAMIGVAAMIGAGIFVLTGRAAGVAGPAFLLAFFLNGLVALLTAGAYAELGAAYPEAGGPFVWVRAAYSRVFAFVTGWLGWASHIVACAVYSLGFGVYFVELLNFFGLIPHPEEMGAAHVWWIKGFAVAIALLLGWVNFVGVSETGRLGAIMSTVKVAILLGFAGFGFARVFGDPEAMANYRPFFSEGVLLPVLLGMGITYMAFEGYEVIVQSSEETIDPDRTIPRAIFLSILIVLPVYLLVGGAALGALSPPAEFAGSNAQYMSELGERVVVEGANQFMLPFGFPGASTDPHTGTAYTVGMFLVILAGIASTVSALNSTIFSSSRSSFAMGREALVPPALGTIHPTRRTPHVALATSVAALLFVALALPIAAVAAAANVMFLLLFAVVNLALIKLRQVSPDMRRPYRLPLVPWVPRLSIAIQAVVAVGIFFLPSADGGASPGVTAWLVVIGWMVAGVLLYAGPFNELKEVERPRVAYEEALHAKQRHRILLAVGYPQTIPALARMAAGLAKVRDGSVHAASVALVPEATLLSAAGERDVAPATGIVRQAKEALEAEGARANATVVVAHGAAEGIVSTARSRDADLLLMGWRGHARSRGFFLGDTLDRVLARSPVPVSVLKAAGDGPWRDIYAAIAGGPNTQAVIETGVDLAVAFGGRLTLAMVARSDEEAEEAATYLEEAATSARERRPGADVAVEVARATRIEDGILEGAKGHDLLILGASIGPLTEKARLGSVQEAVSKRHAGSVLAVRQAEGRMRRFLQRILEE